MDFDEQVDPRNSALVPLRAKELCGQHSKAFTPITTKVVHSSEPLKEKLLKETHTILVHALLNNDFDQGVWQ